jgi:hypothetical protein
VSGHGMAKAPSDNALSLTGQWNGQFSYPRLLDPTPFVAILIEQGARFSGTIDEPCTGGPHIGGRLCATVDGRRDGSAVLFTKTYDGTGGWTHSVSYEGLLNGDGTEIEGRWKTWGWSGRFLMLRSSGTDAAVERKLAEPVGQP